MHEIFKPSRQTDHAIRAWQGTRNVIEAIRKAGSVKRLVLTSSVFCTHSPQLHVALNWHCQAVSQPCVLQLDGVALFMRG